jgi:predicted MFS family arabinose efflux permease
VGGLSLTLTAWTLGHPDPPRAALGSAGSLRALARSRQVALGFWLILLVACLIGATNTLLPLRLSRLGASGVAIGATFVLASLLSTILTPAIGRWIDRRGGLPALTVGLGVTAMLLALLPLPGSALLLAVLTVLALGGPLTGCTIPAMSLMTSGAERTGAAVAFSTMIINLAWALGETVGAPAAATLSRATSDAVPLMLLAGAMLLTIVPVMLARSLRAGASTLGDQPDVAVPVRSSS